MNGTPADCRLLMLIRGLEMGGLEKMAVDLANHLPKRYRVHLCCFDSLGPLEEMLSPAVDKILLKRSPGFDGFYIFKLSRLLRDRKIDILHAHNYTALFYGTTAAKLAGIRKIVYTEHGRTGRLSRKVRLAHRFLSRFVSHTVIVADYLRDVLLSEGFPANRIRLIQNGIDGSAYLESAVAPELMDELGLESDHRRIGIVARLDPIKNHSLLLQAMRRVLEREPMARLLVVGDGPLRDALEKETAELGIQDAVRFLGERADIPAILKSLDLFVLSSLSEGMSLTLVEAMAAGLPIVATEVGGNPALIRSGENGVLVPSGNPAALAEAMLKVLADPAYARALAGAARKRYEADFTLERMIDRYCEVYES